MNLLLLQCKVLDRLNDFFEIFEERLYSIFNHIEVCLVSRNVIEDIISFAHLYIFSGEIFTRDEISVKIVIEEGIHQCQGNMWLIISQFGCNNRVCPCAE